MIDVLEKPQYDIEREQLQRQLAQIDRDPEQLQTFIESMYADHPENPHLLYAAATHLTAISYLDKRDDALQPMLPEPKNARRAFTSYAHMMSMLAHDRDAPRYSENERIIKRLVGAREEVAFHGIMGYATSEGADFVVLPTPSRTDFNGADESSDIQVFFPGTDQPPLEIQITHAPALKADMGVIYHPRIPVLSLATALGGSSRASEVRGLLKDIGRREDRPSARVKLNKRERAVLLDAASDILLAAREWQG